MTYEMSSKAFNVLLINSILAGAFLMVLVRRGGPLLFETVPGSLWSGLAFLALVLPMYPALAIWTRTHKSFELGFGRYLVGALLGALLAPVVQNLL